MSQGEKTLKTIILPPVGPGHEKSAEASLPPKSPVDFQSP